MLDREVHQQGLQHIEEHIQHEKDSHKGIDIGLVLRTIEAAHHYYPNDPVDQRQQVYEVLAISWEVEGDGSADVPHDDAAQIRRNGKQYSY